MEIFKKFFGSKREPEPETHQQAFKRIYNSVKELVSEEKTLEKELENLFKTFLLEYLPILVDGGVDTEDYEIYSYHNESKKSCIGIYFKKFNVVIDVILFDFLSLDYYNQENTYKIKVTENGHIRVERFKIVLEELRDKSIFTICSAYINSQTQIDKNNKLSRQNRIVTNMMKEFNKIAYGEENGE